MDYTVFLKKKLGTSQQFFGSKKVVIVAFTSYVCVCV